MTPAARRRNTWESREGPSVVLASDAPEASEGAVAAAPDETAAPRKKGGKASRAKGNRFESLVVGVLNREGIAAERIPLSGSAGGSFTGDITLPALGGDWRAECKCRAGGFNLIYSALDGNDVLFVKQDRHEPLVVVPLHRFARLLQFAERGKA